MTYLPELRDSLVRASAREYAAAAGARAGAGRRSPQPRARAPRLRSLWGRGTRVIPVALALAVTVVIAGVAVTSLHPARPRPRPAARPQTPLTSILGVLRGPETAPDRAFPPSGFYLWNSSAPLVDPLVRYAGTAPWGDRLFIFAPRTNAAHRAKDAPASQPSTEGWLVGLPRHPLIGQISVNSRHHYSSPVPNPYIPLTTASVEAGRAVFIWPGGESATPVANSWEEWLFGPKEEIAVVVPDGVAKVELVLPRQPMAIVGAPVYPRVRRVTVPVHHNVAVAEIDRKCCYLPAARLQQLASHSDETAQAPGPMVWLGSHGQVIKRIGDFAAAGRVRPLPRPGPPTPASRAAERDPSTPNHVWVTPTTGGPGTVFRVHFRALLTGAGYGYELLRLNGPACQIPGHDAGQTTGQQITGISAGYEPNVVRGDTWDGALSLGSGTSLCPGTYLLSASVVGRGVFGGYGPSALWNPSKPFGSTTFTVRCGGGGDSHGTGVCGPKAASGLVPAGGTAPLPEHVHVVTVGGG